MRLPSAIFRTVFVLVAIFAMISSCFVMTTSGDVLSPIGTGAGAAGNRFGWNITYAGNVNNDTFDDVLVGAPGQNRAYLFLGPVMNLNPAGASVTYTGPAASNFGWSVRTAFDVNNDGFDDVIIGAPDGDAAYIFFGSASPSGTKDYTAADVTLSGGAGSKFGFSVCGVGDFSADGNNDVFVGAPYESAISTYTNGGTVFMFNDVGSRGSWIVGDPNFGPAVNLTAAANNELFGFSISYAGDTNADSLGDLVIGAPGTNTNDGAAYVEWGKPVHPSYKAMSNTVDANLMDNRFFGNGTTSSNSKFGYSVCNASSAGMSRTVSRTRRTGTAPLIVTSTT